MTATAHVTQIRAAELEDAAVLSCIDGRHTDAYLGAPGGNAGEFVLLLAATEKSLRLTFGQDAVTELLRAHLDRFGRFYLHTDVSATASLAASLRRPAPLDVDGATGLLTEVPAEDHAKVLHELGHPDHLGCGHLASMIREARAYGLRRQLVQAVVRAFFTLLWEGDPRPLLMVLDGPHEELDVWTYGKPGATPQEECCIAMHSPPPNEQHFALHRPAIAYLRERTADWMAARMSSPNLPQAWLRPRIGMHMEKLGRNQLQTTLDRLAKGLPVRRIGDDCRCRM